MDFDCWKKYHDFCIQDLRKFPAMFTKSLAVAVCLGQLLSLLISGTAVTSGLLQNESVFIPTGQSFFAYILLSAVFTSWICCNTEMKNILNLLKDRGWKYFFIALIDVEANYLVVKAYQLTSVTSIQLLDCVTIPTVLILSWCLFGIRYQWTHFVGIVICVLGAASLMLADHFIQKNTAAGSDNLLGDILVLGGAILYGISNICQEMMVSRHGTLEYLGLYSLFASFISGTQFIILERQEVAVINFSSRIVLLLVGFIICLFVLMAVMSFAMRKIGAMAVNLNLLSSDFFALLVGIFVFQYKFHALYFVSFILIMCGLIIYNLRPPISQHVLPLVEATGNSEEKENKANGTNLNSDNTDSNCEFPGNNALASDSDSSSQWKFIPEI